MVDLKNHLKYLTDKHGFQIKEERDDSALLGDGLIVFETSEVLIKITKDKDQYFCDVASQREPNNWFQLVDLVNVVEKTNLVHQDYNDDFNHLNDLLKAHIGAILPELKNNFKDIRENVAKIEKERAAKLFPGA